MNRASRSVLLAVAIVSVVLAPRGVRGAGPKFTSELSPGEVRAGQVVELTITAAWEGDATACVLGQVDLELPDDVERVSAQPASGAVTVREGKPISTFTYTCGLKPLKPGEFTLDEVEVKFRVATTKPDEWETWKPSEPIKFTATRGFAVPKGVGISVAIIGGIVLLGVGIFVVSAVRYRRASEEPEEQDLEGPVLERLSELRSLRIKGDYKAFFGRLEELAREYLKQKYAITAEGDSPLVMAVEKHFDESTSRRLGEVLRLAENVRFGGAPPLPSDLDRAHTVVKEILERNRPKQESSPEEQIAFRDS